MADGRARFASMLLDRAADEVPESPTATVVEVVAGASTDGNALVTISYLGSRLRVPYKAHYTPGVGHKVTLSRAGGKWVIDGQIIGFPPEHINDLLET